MTTKREEAIRLAEQAGFHTNEYGVYSPYIEGSALNVPIMRLIQLVKNEAYSEVAGFVGNQRNDIPACGFEFRDAIRSLIKE